MKNENFEKIQNYLDEIVGLSLSQGFKLPGFDDMYIFGFGSIREEERRGKKVKIAQYNIHAQCSFLIEYRDGSRRVDKYSEETSSEKFEFDIKKLIGLTVQYAKLSEKNDLFLRVGEYRIIFATWENSEESWRYLLTTDRNSPHLIASDTSLEMYYSSKIVEASIVKLFVSEGSCLSEKEMKKIEDVKSLSDELDRLDYRIRIGDLPTDAPVGEYTVLKIAYDDGTYVFEFKDWQYAYTKDGERSFCVGFVYCEGELEKLIEKYLLS